ncbi:7-deoxyloganetin glucosyltransferase-like protein [Drosera capensis]
MDEKPHAVCVPYPAQGHINAILRLAKLLYIKGFHITRQHGIQPFESIPDGLPPADNDDVTEDITALIISMESTSGGPFRELLSRLNDTATSSVPPVSCIIADAGVRFTSGVGRELGISKIIIFPASACSFLGISQYRCLAEKGYVPLKDESYFTNGYLDTVIDWIPGMEGTTDPNDYLFNHAIDAIERIRRTASAIIFNTFTALYRDLISSLSADFPPLYPIGPVHLLVNQIQHGHIETKSLGSNLWKEEPACLLWLDARQPGSVVYINFGSITVMTPSQLEEFAWGLAHSKHYFLWIKRPDLVSGDASDLPAGFVEETKGRGLMASWCDQESVLSHPAIGVFLTHCGWNSTIESISSAVPMICWPFFADQQTNCWYTSKKWGIGMEINSEAEREEIEKQVREMMEGQKGREMKNKAMEWKSLAEEAATWGSGSSYLNLENLIQDVLLASKIKEPEGST